jgi:hypothetical protein
VPPPAGTSTVSNDDSGAGPSVPWTWNSNSGWLPARFARGPGAGSARAGGSGVSRSRRASLMPLSCGAASFVGSTLCRRATSQAVRVAARRQCQLREYIPN